MCHLLCRFVTGIYRLKVPDMYIDINDIPELHHISKNNDFLTVGSNISLTVAMETFINYSKEQNFHYLRHLADHIDLIASVPVRNVCMRQKFRYERRSMLKKKKI